MYFRAPEFERLMQLNQEFCVAWANAQLEAGATAICYFDPLASPNIIEREKYLSTGHRIAKQTIGRIKGPVATHLASGIALPVIDDIIGTGSAVLGFSAADDLVEIKKATQNKICLLGNLNGIDMVNWDSHMVNEEIKNLIAKAGKGGGLIISDNHGEIPWQVPESVLMEISEAVSRYGTYPLKQV
jgi:uroporphyrinogen decarboxylase